MADTTKEVASPPEPKGLRSNIYPRYDLEDALEFAKAIHAVGGERVPKATVASEIQTPMKSSGFLGRISSAKQFGLIEVDGSSISISSRAKRIFLPTSDEDKQNALLEAFSEPPLYKRLIQNFNGNNLPNKNALGNTLVHDRSYGIKENARLSAAGNFITSAEYVSVLKNGMLVANVVESDDKQNDNNYNYTEQPIQTAPQQNSYDQRQSTISHSTTNYSDQDSFVFDFDGEVRLIIPKTTTSSEAIADGELKDVRKEIKKFATAFLKEHRENVLAQEGQQEEVV